ncbi:MAG: hypothetical protein JXB05_30225 [Myxococcaceae bacterium]|nr:hypothetical protein [Myxococcaceae bacterium]
MLHRIYLSVLWLFVTGGVATVCGVAVVQVHDHVVVGEDRECFTKVFAEHIKAGVDDWEEEPFDPDAFLRGDSQSQPKRKVTTIITFAPDGAVVSSPKCNVICRSASGAPGDDLSEFSSTRAWHIGSLAAEPRWPSVALASLSFLPAVLLSLARRWWRWVRAGATSPPTK